MKRLDAGFTLLELLIALALVGLLTVLLFSGLRMGSNAWDKTEDSTDRSSSMRLVWQFLQNHLQEARIVSVPASEKGFNEIKNAVIFSGLENGLEFVALMTPSLGAGGVYVLRVDAVEHQQKQQLRLSRWLYHPEILAGAKGLPDWEPLTAADVGNQREEDPELTAYYSESILLDDLQQFEVRYFGPESDENGATIKLSEPQWTTEWLQKQQLPWLIGIRIQDRNDQWPEMIFSLPH